MVATVLTVYGIETDCVCAGCKAQTAGLQQCLPFTVLKLFNCVKANDSCFKRCNSAYRLRY